MTTKVRDAAKSADRTASLERPQRPTDARRLDIVATFMGLAAGFSSVFSRFKKPSEIDQVKKRMINDLLRRFENSSTPDEITRLSSELYRQFLRSGRIPTGELHNILARRPEDTKRACIFQLLAQAGDDSAFPYFAQEIDLWTNVGDVAQPSITLITAVTFVRFLKVPSEQVWSLVNNIQTCAEMYRETQSRKQLVAGALISVGVLGNLQLSSEFILSFLTDSDATVVEEAMDALGRIWIRTARHDPKELDRYRTRLSSCLTNLAEKHIHSVDGLGEENGITADEMIVAHTLPLLVQVDPKAARPLLSSLFRTALKSEDVFLQGTIIPAIRALPVGVKSDLLTELVAGKHSEDLVKLCNFILG